MRTGGGSADAARNGRTCSPATVDRRSAKKFAMVGTGRAFRRCNVTRWCAINTSRFELSDRGPK